MRQNIDDCATQIQSIRDLKRTECLAHLLYKTFQGQRFKTEITHIQVLELGFVLQNMVPSQKKADWVNRYHFRKLKEKKKEMK
jgi:hypothetical protein